MIFELRTHFSSMYGPVPTGLAIARPPVVRVGLDHLARDRRRRLVGKYVGQVVVGILEADAQRVAVDRLEAGHLRVVVELAALLRRLGRLVQPDDLALDQEGPRRTDLRIDQPLQRDR